jgi:hypothetical protein
MLAEYWSPDHDAFMLKDQLLKIEVDEIQFITGFSRQGEPINLISLGGGGMTRDEYIPTHYDLGTQNVGTQIPIKNKESPILKIILFTIAWVDGSTSLQQELHP